MASTPPSLLHRLRDRPDDDQAWKRFDDLYRPLLAYWLRQASVAEGDIDDLLQEIFQILVSKLPQFQYDPGKGKFRGWLRQVMTNQVKNHQRKRKKQDQPAGNDETLTRLLAELEDPNSNLTRRWDQEHDEHVLSRLLALVERDFDPRTWDAFRRRMNGEDARDVASFLGMSVNAVYQACSHVLRRLREEANGLVD